MDVVVDAAGVAKAPFCHHFQNTHLAAAASEIDQILTPARPELRDSIARLAFGFTVGER